MALVLKPISWMVRVAVLTVLGLQFTPSAMAFQMNDEVMGWIPVKEEVLAGMRGGFQRGVDGPFMSFGIERNVYLDEKLVSSTRLGIADMQRLSDLRDVNPLTSRGMNSAAPSDMRGLGRPGENFTYLHSGSRDSMNAGLATLPAFMTLIQNGRDDRTFQTDTTITAAVGAMGMAKSLSLGFAVSDGNLGALRH